MSQTAPTLWEIPADPPELAAAADAVERLLDANTASDEALPALEHRAALEAQTLAGLSAAARVLALATWGVRTSHRERPLSLDLPVVVDRRMRHLLDGFELVGQALGGAVRDVRSISRLWHDLKFGGDTARFAVATTLAVAAEIPLEVLEPAHVTSLGDPALSGLLGLAMGRAARDGCRHALRIARDCLSRLPDRPAGRSACIGIIKGLGDGLAGDGLRWLTEYTERAVIDRDEWARGAHRAACLALAWDAPEGPRLAAVAMAEAADAVTSARRVAELLAAAGPVRGRALGDAWRRDWTAWPPGVRAALLSRTSAPLSLDAPWLRDRSPEVLLEGLLQLQERPPLELEAAAAGTPALIDLLDHRDQRVRRAVATLLVGLRRTGTAARSLPDPPGAQVVALPPSILARTPVEKLHAALWTGDSDAVPESVEALSGNDHAAALGALRGAIEIPDMALRRAIVDALGVLGGASEVSALLDVARRYRTLEGHVAGALRRLGATGRVDELAELFRRRLKWADDQALDDFCALAGDAHGEHLLEAIETRFYPAARRGAARAIADHRVQEGVFALRKACLTDPQEDVRIAATASLKALNMTPPSTDELAGYALLFRPIAALEEVVERAREAGSAALPGLRKTLANGSWKRRRAVCDVLGSLEDPEARRTLLERLGDPDEDVRLAALKALERQGWRASTPVEHTRAALAARRLGPLLATPDRVDVATMEEALDLGGHVFRKEVLAALEQRADWRPGPGLAAKIRATLLDSRGALGEPDGLSTLLSLIDRTWQAIPHQARLARALDQVPISQLLTEACDGDRGWRVRESLCHALGRPHEDGGVAALEGWVRDDDDDVRRAALHALARIGTAAAAAAISRGVESPFSEDRKPVAFALAAIGEPALATVRALATSPWWEARQVAATALAEWREDRQQAVDLLIELAVDPEFKANEPAREGLLRHGLQPSAAAVERALARAQLATIEGLEPWLRLGAGRSVQDRETMAALRDALDEADEDFLPQRLGLAAALRARDLEGRVRELTTSGHLGVRLSAADTLRKLANATCHLCEGRGSIRCPGCDSEGEQTCDRCGGGAMVRVACPELDCNAAATTREIHSKPCPTCRGRGSLPTPCECATGHVTCELCRGSGRNRCPLCDGSGEPW